MAKNIIALMPLRCKNPNAPAADDPGWLHYVEPYFGGGQVMLAMDPEGISEVANDKNHELINFWSVLAFGDLFEKFHHIIQQTPFAQAVFEAVAKAPKWNGGDSADEIVQRAARFYVLCRQSLSGRMKGFASITRNRTRRGMNEQVSAWLNAIEGLPEVHARLKRVLILNDDALTVIRKEDGPRTLFYLDPPYLHETRATTDEYGEYEMRENDHRALLNALSCIKGRFLLSGYHNEIYDERAKTHDWQCHEFKIDNKASGGKTKRQMTECVWTNY